jgi:hypothetical protein
MEILISKDKKVLISESDIDTFNKYNWYYDSSNGYAMTWKNRKKIYLHRFLMGAVGGEIIDHKNRIKLDNRRENLRRVYQVRE